MHTDTLWSLQKITLLSTKTSAFCTTFALAREECKKNRGNLISSSNVEKVLGQKMAFNINLPSKNITDEKPLLENASNPEGHNRSLG